mgnify:CR=1 FL=1
MGAVTGTASPHEECASLGKESEAFLPELRSNGTPQPLRSTWIAIYHYAMVFSIFLEYHSCKIFLRVKPVRGAGFFRKVRDFPALVQPNRFFERWRVGGIFDLFEIVLGLDGHKKIVRVPADICKAEKEMWSGVLNSIGRQIGRAHV